MDRTNLVIALALAGAFTGGCTTQGASSQPGKRELQPLDPTVIQVVQDFRKTLDEAPVKIGVFCGGPTNTNCTSYPSAQIVNVNNTQTVTFTIVPTGWVFDYPGIDFPDKSFTCTRTSGIKYTCTPNNPSVDFHKYTIKIVNTTPNDPFVFTYN
jgi:hypothetical protein